MRTKIEYVFRRPRFPVMLAVDRELIAAASPAAFQREIGQQNLQKTEPMEMVDATGEGWAFHPDLMVVSPLTLKKRWRKVDVIRLFNQSDNSRRIGKSYPEEYIPRRSLARIIAEVSALAAHARRKEPRLNSSVSPNPRLQRTRLRSPLSRKS